MSATARTSALHLARSEMNLTASSLLARRPTSC